MSDNRRVHASYLNQEVVRYDRAGHWYLESSDRTTKINIAEAVRLAVKFMAAGGDVNFGVPGGARFDAKVRSAIQAQEMKTDG